MLSWLSRIRFLLVFPAITLPGGQRESELSIRFRDQAPPLTSTGDVWLVNVWTTAARRSGVRRALQRARRIAGTVAGHPQLQPAVKVAVVVSASVMVGVEGYGAFGPIDDLGRERVERVFGVVDVKGSWWDLDVGLGASWGLPDHPIGKLIFGLHPF